MPFCLFNLLPSFESLSAFFLPTHFVWADLWQILSFVLCGFGLLLFPVVIKMKKIVVKLAIEDEKAKRKAFKLVAGVEGVDSVAVDMKEKKITIIGEADPVYLTAKLRKLGFTELLSVGRANEKRRKRKNQMQIKKINPKFRQ